MNSTDELEQAALKASGPASPSPILGEYWFVRHQGRASSRSWEPQLRTLPPIRWILFVIPPKYWQTREQQ